MVRKLTNRGVKVPDEFSITAEAYRHFIREARLFKNKSPRRIASCKNCAVSLDIAARSPRIARSAIAWAKVPIILRSRSASVCNAWYDLGGGKMSQKACPRKTLACLLHHSVSTYYFSVSDEFGTIGAHVPPGHCANTCKGLKASCPSRFIALKGNVLGEWTRTIP